MMTDYYIPAINLLAPVPEADKLQHTPAEIYQTLRSLADGSLGSLNQGEILRTGRLTVNYKDCIVERRIVRVGLEFIVEDGEIVAPTAAQGIESIKFQLRKIYN